MESQHQRTPDPHDQREREKQFTICPNCGEDLEWHDCGATPSERTLRIRELNDAFRKQRDPLSGLIAGNRLVVTRGVAKHGGDFLDRALNAVRHYDDFSPENDPYAEHDFGSFTLDGYRLLWKIDYYDADMERGSEDPSDPEETRRVLTILLAEEY